MRTRTETTPRSPPPDRQPVDAEPKVEEPPPEEGLEVQAPPPEVRPEDLVLDPVVDDLGRRLETEREGLGEPDPLVLAKSPAVVLPAILQCIPGPRERAQAQDRDPVLTRVKDWVHRGIRPERLELDSGEDSLKAYVKVLPVLKLNPVPPEPDLEDLDILVKTDIHRTIQSERYCVPEELIVPLITDLHLRLTHFGTETVTMMMRHLVWFRSIWARTRQVLLRCPGCMQKYNNQSDTRIAGCYYPREKGNIAEYLHLDLAGPLPESMDGGRYILGIQCNFSGYCVAVPIKNKEHKTMVKGFLDNWVYRFRPPAVLISDNEWTSQVFKILCQSFQVDHRMTLFYNPRSNTQIERSFGNDQTTTPSCDQGTELDRMDKLVGTRGFQCEHHSVQDHRDISIPAGTRT